VPGIFAESKRLATSIAAESRIGRRKAAFLKRKNTETATARQEVGTIAALLFFNGSTLFADPDGGTAVAGGIPLWRVPQ
jgi:hypothetical protein